MSGLREALISSTAGKLVARLEEIKSVIQGDVKLSFPQIIVVGSESSGKSSVLERIAMMEFFPKGEDITTRMPVKLKMEHQSPEEMEQFKIKNKLENDNSEAYIKLSYTSSRSVIEAPGIFHPGNIKENVKKYMEQAVQTINGGVSGIISDVLTIHIFSTLVPNLTLVDLPGIISARYPNEPEDMKKQTKDLVKKYLMEQDTLVLAIVTATERIRNSVSIGLVQQYRKESQTIGVLTKSDLFHHTNRSDPVEELKKKLDGKSSDFIELENGYFATRNRDSKDGLKSLTDAAEEERQFFKKYFPNHSSSTGSDALIKRIVEMICNYVKKTWLKSALASLESSKTKIKLEESKLGISVDSLGFDKKVIAAFQELWKSKFRLDLSDILNDDKLLFQPLQNTGVISYKQLERYFSSQLGLENAVKELPKKIRDVISQFTLSIKDVCSNSVLPLRLDRLVNLSKYLIDYLRNTFSFDSLVSHAMEIINTTGEQLILLDAVEDLRSLYKNAILRTICKPLCGALSDDDLYANLKSHYSSQFQNMFIESNEVSSKRKQLERSSSCVAEATTLLSQLTEPVDKFGRLSI